MTIQNVFAAFGVFGQSDYQYKLKYCGSNPLGASKAIQRGNPGGSFADFEFPKMLLQRAVLPFPASQCFNVKSNAENEIIQHSFQNVKLWNENFKKLIS